jgi:hypothetical protein
MINSYTEEVFNFPISEIQIKTIKKITPPQ